MLKMIIESWKKDGMSRDAFIDYLANVHGPLVRQHGRALGFRKYVQNLRLPSREIDDFGAGRGWAEAPDSSVEIWFDSIESLQAAFASPEGRAAGALLEVDERQFVDPARVSAFLSTEEVVFDFLAPGQHLAPDSELVKMVVQVWKKPDMTTEAFQTRWRVGHGDLVRENSRSMGFLRYVQSYPVPCAEIDGFAKARGWREAPDGLTEVWWDSEAGMIETFKSEATARSSAILAEDEVKFIYPPKISAFLAREHVVFDDTRELV